MGSRSSKFSIHKSIDTSIAICFRDLTFKSLIEKKFNTFIKIFVV